MPPVVAPHARATGSQSTAAAAYKAERLVISAHDSNSFLSIVLYLAVSPQPTVIPPSTVNP
jgi:hypothetical protein